MLQHKFPASAGQSLIFADKYRQAGPSNHSTNHFLPEGTIKGFLRVMEAYHFLLPY
jgi:hypothetical protein